MTIGDDYRPDRLVVLVMHAHLVFVTKYRRDVLAGGYIAYLTGVFTEVCDDFGVVLVQCHREEDHVHQVEYPPKVSVAALMNSTRGVSARKLRQRCRVRAHREHLLSPSYLAPSCGRTPLSTISQYIEHQRIPGG